MTKRCSLCQEIRELSHYNKMAQAKDGLGYHCRECRNKLCQLSKLKAKGKLPPDFKIAESLKKIMLVVPSEPEVTETINVLPDGYEIVLKEGDKIVAVSTYNKAGRRHGESWHYEGRKKKVTMFDNGVNLRYFKIAGNFLNKRD